MSEPCIMAGEIREIKAAVANSEATILAAIAASRKELYGNGARNPDGTQAGVIPYLERHLTAIDHRLDEADQKAAVAAEVEAEVEKEMTARKIDHQVDAYRDGLEVKAGQTPWARVVTLAIEHWQVWLILGVVLGRDGLQTILVQVLGLIAAPMVGGGGP